MHIHKTKFRKHVKRLLRISYRDGGKVRKFTLVNLTRWTEEDLAHLERLLQAKREASGGDSRKELGARIFEFVASRTPEANFWKLTCLPMVVRMRQAQSCSLWEMI
jgi:hypothetical protein